MITSPELRSSGIPMESKEEVDRQTREGERSQRKSQTYVNLKQNKNRSDWREFVDTLKNNGKIT